MPKYTVDVYYETESGNLMSKAFGPIEAEDMDAAVEWARKQIRNDKRRRIYRTHGRLIL